MIKFCISILFCTISLYGITQFTIIPTSTVSPITEIIKSDTVVFINGRDGYFSKCYGGCNDVIELTVPGYTGYYRDNVLDTNTIYLSSHVDFPHHGYIYKSVDGGVSWGDILDTTDILFTDFLMFDTLDGVVVSTFYHSLLTNDDGITWATGSHGLVQSSASLKIDDSTAIIGASEHVFLTMNKGQTWSGGTFVQSPPRAFFSNDPDSLYAVTSGIIGIFFSYNFNSISGSWTNNSIPDFEPYGLFVKNTNEIYVVGNSISEGNCAIIKTTDIGLTWSIFDTGISGTLYDIEFLSDSIALLGGSNGLLLKWNSNSHFEFADLIDTEMENLTISMYPNPCNTQQTLIIFTEDQTNCRIELIDSRGKSVDAIFEGILDHGKNSIDVPLGQFSSGIYYYQIFLDDSIVHNEKIIITNQ